MKRLGILTAVFMMGALAPKADAWWGRKYTGGHPYHNGYLAVPPASAYEAVRLRPPAYYGAPAYYYPQSYLGVGNPYQPSWSTYPYIPAQRSAAYYMSAHSQATVYPW